MLMKGETRTEEEERREGEPQNTESVANAMVLSWTQPSNKGWAMRGSRPNAFHRSVLRPPSTGCSVDDGR